MVPRPKHLEGPPPQGPRPKGGPALGPPTAAANSAAEKAKEVIARLLAAAGASSSGEGEEGASASASASASAVADAAEQREAASAFRRLDREAAVAAGAAAAAAAALGDPAGAEGAGLTDAEARSEVCLGLNYFVQRTGAPGSDDAADARRDRVNAEAPELLERMVPCLPLPNANGHRGAVFAVFYLVKDSDADLRRLRAVPGVLDALRALDDGAFETEKIASLIEWLEAIPAILTKRAVS